MDQIIYEWENFFHKTGTSDWWGKKKNLYEKRGAEVVRIKGKGHLYRIKKYDDVSISNYKVHLTLLIKHGDDMYVEELVLPFSYQTKEGKLYKHEPIPKRSLSGTVPTIKLLDSKENKDMRFTYDRLAAVKYAERWWNDYNPAFRKFDVDCTNYISQCLLAGGATMHGAPDRERGWWYQENNWSFSWAVAHSMRWYLSGATSGLQGKEVSSAKELIPGDVICYDFEGDGRWDHTTIVVAKDANDMPLVNAHTNNSRHRYWTYEDSAAWTQNINYKFFRIGE